MLLVFVACAIRSRGGTRLTRPARHCPTLVRLPALRAHWRCWPQRPRRQYCGRERCSCSCHRSPAGQCCRCRCCDLTVTGAGGGADDEVVQHCTATIVGRVVPIEGDAAIASGCAHVFWCRRWRRRHARCVDRFCAVASTIASRETAEVTRAVGETTDDGRRCRNHLADGAGVHVRR